MDITRGRELQERIGLDALTQWTLFGTATDTGMQERCIRIVGKTWDIPEEETQAWLDAIARERSYAESGSSEHVRPEEELRRQRRMMNPEFDECALNLQETFLSR